jgi:hypothetical protein
MRIECSEAAVADFQNKWPFVTLAKLVQRLAFALRF